MVDDPAHYRWTSYRHNALGQANPYLTPHGLYRGMGRDATERPAAYRELFRAQLDGTAIDDIRLALNQSQPLGNRWAIRASMPRSRPRPDKGGKPSRAAGRVPTTTNPRRATQGRESWDYDSECRE